MKHSNNIRGHGLILTEYLGLGTGSVYVCT